jgi:hypothetical protein
MGLLDRLAKVGEIFPQALKQHARNTRSNALDSMPGARPARDNSQNVRECDSWFV